MRYQDDDEEEERGEREFYVETILPRKFLTYACNVVDQIPLQDIRESRLQQ